MSDMKRGLGKKAPLAQVPPALLNYAARAHQYGADKYQLGNYLRRPPKGMRDVDRLLEYISATQRHLALWADSIIRFLGDGVENPLTINPLTIEEACFAADAESGLPHGSHAAASLGIAIQQAADAGLMPFDPGTPWRTK